MKTRDQAIEKIKINIYERYAQPIKDEQWGASIESYGNPLPEYVAVKDFINDTIFKHEILEKTKSVLLEIKKTISKEINSKQNLDLYDYSLYVNACDSKLSNALECFEKNFNLCKLHFPAFYRKTCYKYTDNIKKMYFTIIEKALNLIKKLDDLLALNGLYSYLAFRSSLKLSRVTKEEDALKRLQSIDADLDRQLSKTIDYDVLSPDCKPVVEMCNCISNAVKTLLCCSVYTTEFEYYVKSNDEKIDPENYFKELLSHHYKNITNFIENSKNFSKYNDYELEQIYKNLMKEEIEIKPDPKSLISSSKNKLEKMIGLDNVKETIKKIQAYAIRNKKKKDLNLHMAFYGNPGTGKTAVARIIANILYANGIIKTNKIVEVDRGDLVGQYVGWTALEVKEKVKNAMGGVLFIDEAYALADDTSFGKEAISTLIKEMEDKRGKFVVILAGYKKPLEDMIQTNPGFKSRIQFHVEFKNYTRSELSQIALDMVRKEKYKITDKALDRLLDVTDIMRKDSNFANAREIRNAIDQIIMCQNLRDQNNQSDTLDVVDVDKYIESLNIKIPLKVNNKASRILTGEEQLNNLIGLQELKSYVNKIRAFAKKNNSRDINLNMCFSGNPGTGKTVVARIISRILYENKALKDAKVVETDANGLISKYAGGTASKTKEMVDKAMGGVLFIDEAYSLMDNTYGDEAIAVLIKAMEDYRGNLCVILAGYKKEMENFINTNPGFESRIQFFLNFEDYNTSELKLIAKKMANDLDYEIEEKAVDIIGEILEIKKHQPNFANARDVRNLIEESIMNQNVRTENTNSKLITKADVVLFAKENGLFIDDDNENKEVIENECAMLQLLSYNCKIDLDYINQCIVSISGRGEGTGFLISPTGLCLTCAHCIENDGLGQKARVNVMFPNKEVKTFYQKFNILKVDNKNDIALIKLDNNGLLYKFLMLSPNKEYSPLDDFVMAGYPFGGEKFANLSLTEGKIASVNYVDDRKVVFADMFGKPGNSGSPIIDKKTNYVIGIYWGGIQSGNDLINCFTPIEFIDDILEIKHG